MSKSIVVLTEEPLVSADVRNIATLHAGDDIHYTLLVPSDTKRNLLLDFFDNLSMLHVARRFAIYCSSIRTGMRRGWPPMRPSIAP